jgi:16S rRNA (guanine966-N2)-methyltransferase
MASALMSRGLIVDARVLDLFAGTGALGFEAISRGATSLTSVESDPKVARALQDATRKLGIASACETLTLDAFSPRLLRALHAKRFDLVFVDPPYALAEGVPAVLDALMTAGVFTEETTIVLEHADKITPRDPDRFATFARYEYGATVVRFLGPRAVGET